jgi:hypothetical protein
MESAYDALDVQLTAKERVQKVATSLPAGGFNQVRRVRTCLSS